MQNVQGLDSTCAVPTFNTIIKEINKTSMHAPADQGLNSQEGKSVTKLVSQVHGIAPLQQAFRLHY